MDTRLATKNIRIQQWVSVIKAKGKSGLTVDEYCEQNGISRNSYYYWLRKIKNAALHNTQASFVEVKLPQSELAPLVSTPNSSFISQLTLERDGFVIGVNAETPKELLIMALEAVAHVE